MDIGCWVMGSQDLLLVCGIFHCISEVLIKREVSLLAEISKQASVGVFVYLCAFLSKNKAHQDLQRLALFLFCRKQII